MFYSVESIKQSYGYIMDTIRNIIMPIFIIEYICRVIAAGYLNKYRGFLGKIKYIFTPYAIIDFLAILPYLLLNAGFNSSFIRGLRLFRIFRLFRIKKYALFVNLIKNIFRDLKEEFVVLLLFTILLLIILSFIIFDIEHKAQPHVFTNIFETLWWSVATLTTIGYGDMYPITPLGKFITGIISIFSIAFIAIPGGMFASKFIEAISEYKNIQNKNMEKYCCYCGSKRIEDLKNTSLIINGKNQIKDFKKCLDCGSIFVLPKKDNKKIDNNIIKLDIK